MDPRSKRPARRDGEREQAQAGLIGANCSSGRRSRWCRNAGRQLADCLKPAQMADEAGIDFMLPIGRWKGYGGDTDIRAGTLETVTWASGLLGQDQAADRVRTRPCPADRTTLSPPRNFVTADHIGEGASGSTSWSAGTRANSRCSASSSATTRRATSTRREWLDAIKLARLPQEDFDFDGRPSNSEADGPTPNQYGGTRPLIMNAGASPTGQAFAIRNCDALFSNISNGISFEETAAHAQKRAGWFARRKGDRRLYRGRRHLPAHYPGGGGLLAPLSSTMPDWRAVDNILSG